MNEYLWRFFQLCFSLLIFPQLFFSLWAGNAYQGREILEEEFFHHWKRALGIEIVAYSGVNEEKGIVFPYNTWRPLFRIDVPDSPYWGKYFSTRKRTECVYYLTPSKIPGKRWGSLKVIPVASRENFPCPMDGMLLPGKTVDGIRHLTLKIGPEKTSILFSIFFTDSKYGYQRELPLVHMIRGLSPGLMSSLAETNMLEHVFFFPPMPSKIPDVGLTPPVDRTLGEITDGFSLTSNPLCLEVNSACQVVGRARCHLCRYGSFETVSTCSQQGNRYCGPDSCGQKNAPACLRAKYPAQGIVSGCDEMKAVSICGPELTKDCALGTVFCR